MTTPLESFCCAYWDFLRGKVALEPNAAQYGLSRKNAKILRKQCEPAYECCDTN